MVKSLIIGTALAEAVAYARSIIQDPVKKAEYQEKPIKDKRVCRNY